MWRLNNILLKKWVKEKRKGEIKRPLEANKNDNLTYQNFWNAAKAVMRKFYIITGLSQGTAEIPSKQPNITS